MSGIFNENFNDHENILKNSYVFQFGKQAQGFFGDNSKQLISEHSPEKIFNNEKKNLISTDNSNLFSLKTVDNTEANFKKVNFKSCLANEFQMQSIESSKLNASAYPQINSQNLNNCQNEILYSGYFGQKYDTKKINDEKFSKIPCKQTNPFTNIIEEDYNNKSIIDEDKENFDNPELNKFESFRNNNTFMEETDKKFHEFLNFKNLENKNFGNATNKNAYEDCNLFKTNVNTQVKNKNEENENKKQLNNLVRSVTISSFNSIINDNANNRINSLTNSSSNIFGNGFGFNQSCSLQKKKKILTSEEILLEKIKKEKEEIKKLKEINTLNFQKSKLYINKPLAPTPLTIIKPFNLSSNNSKMLMKKRYVPVNAHEINNKITEHMKKKCESQGIKENVFINNKIIMNKTPNQFKFISKTEKSNSKSPIKKMTFSYEPASNYNNSTFLNNKSKYSNLNENGNCLNLEEENSINNLSNRIEKYCNISKRYLIKKTLNNNLSNNKSDRSDLSANKNSHFLDKKPFATNSNFNFHLDDDKENEYSNDNFINFTGNNRENFNDFNDAVNPLNVSVCGATSIRKMFDFENDKENKKESGNLYRFKARPLKKEIFNQSNFFNDKTSLLNNFNIKNNNAEIGSFQAILEKSRQDKFAMDKLEKEKTKKAKINEIKVSKYTLNRDSYNNLNNKKTTTITNNLYKKNNNPNKNKIVDFNELMLTDE